MKTLIQIHNENYNCTKCELSKDRENIVFGIGNPEAELMVIGEAPGFNEDKSGKPFSGRAGDLLTKMLRAITIERSSIYITNILKCRPPKNRDPLPNEIASCTPILEEQINAIQPKVILLTGLVASKHYMNDYTLKMKDIRGSFIESERWPNIKAMPVYHPAALLRNEALKKPAWEDLKKLREYLEQNTSLYGSN